MKKERLLDSISQQFKNFLKPGERFATAVSTEIIQEKLSYLRRKL